MLILIIEIIMLITGIWALVTGKLPSLLFGGSKYVYEESDVRLLGLIMVLQLPVTFIGLICLFAILGESAQDYGNGLGFLIFTVSTLAMIIVDRQVRKPAVKLDDQG